MNSVARTDGLRAAQATVQPLEEVIHQWGEERPDLDPTPFMLVGAVMQLAQLFEMALRLLAQSEFGIGASDMRILFALRRSGKPYELRSTDLFQSLLVSSGAITKQVDRLVEGGFVKRVLPKGSARRRVIGLTPKGVQAAGRVQAEIATSLSGIAPTLAGLPKAKVRTTLATLTAVLSAAVAQHTAAGNANADD